MIPVISIVGKSKAGKTTLIEGLVAELKQRGYRVATLKHSPQGFELDLRGKDSWRYVQSGSDAVVISSPQKLAMIRPQDHDATIEELLAFLGPDFDIVLAEGFRKGSGLKIEVHRKAVGEGLLLSPKELLAIVSDEPVEADVPQFSPQDISGVASFIEEKIISKWPEEETVLLVNGSRLALNRFTREIIANALVGMVSALKGVGKIKSLHVFVRRKG
jgi:molybdopterin-guanine dinucleotide biosynthesis protein B